MKGKPHKTKTFDRAPETSVGNRNRSHIDAVPFQHPTERVSIIFFKKVRQRSDFSPD
jgi:hypothetical protein